MLAPQAATSEPTDHRVNRLQTEAEALGNLLMDLGVFLSVRLDEESLFAQVEDDTKPGALDVLKQVTGRFQEDAEFREDLIVYIGATGYYLADAPGIDAAFSQAPASDLLAAADKAGLLVLLGPLGGVSVLSFMLRGETPKPNSHLLMKLITDRFYSEPAFAADVRNHLTDKSTPHTA